MPASLTAGDHRVMVQDSAGAVYGWAALTVAAATSTPAAQANGSLAQTGVDAGTLLAAAGLLLLAGLVIGGFTLSRRRRGATL